MNFKKLLLLLLCVLTCVALVACVGGKDPCTEHVDEDGNNICDECGETIEDPGESNTLHLIENGKANFTFVVSSDSPSSVLAAVDKVIRNLSSAGITVTRVDETATPTECEILIGKITNRGAEYTVDVKELGPEGYAIKLVNKKIVIASNSTETLADTVKSFAEDTLGIKKGMTELKALTVTDSINITKKKGTFRITSIKVADELIDNMYILVDRNNVSLSTSALAFKTAVLQRYGCDLEVLNSIPENDTRKYIEFKQVEDAGSGGYKISVSNGCLLFETEFPHKAMEVTQAFINSNIVVKMGEISFKAKFKYTEDIRVIYYSEFGASGDGIYDDFTAIQKTHDYANMYGHTVAADNNAKYYIGNTNGQYVTVKTDTNWGNATFIIDDKAVEYTKSSRTLDIFVMRSDYESIRLEADHPVVMALNANGGIDADTITNIGYAPGYAAMLIPYDETHRVYIRSGLHGDNLGAIQKELVLIDKDGNIDPESRFLLDYANVSYIDVYRVDDTPITLKGGTFITKANDAPRKYNYYNRGLGINRSNVTIKDVVHKIEGEGSSGAPYTGFINPYRMNNLLVEGCTLQSHKTYIEERDDGNQASMGTYDISGNLANNLYFKNCVQSNFFDPNGTPYPNAMYWGIMGTNYCKNITYDGCTLSRLDAHSGVLNASVINGSKVCVINLIGGGKAVVKDSIIYNANEENAIVYLRSDYGSTWKGTLEVRNVDYINKTSTQAFIAKCDWQNHYFGYTTYMPSKIIVDNLRFAIPCNNVYFVGPLGIEGCTDPDILFKDGNGDYTIPNINPMVPIEEAILLNNKNGYNYSVSNQAWLRNLVTIKTSEDE